MQKQNAHIGKLVVDIFTKYCQVAVTSCKKKNDILAVLVEGLTKTQRIPQVVYTNDESTFATNDVQELLEEKI